MPESTVRLEMIVAILAALLLPMTGGGCGGQRVAAPVDPQQARATLNAVLADWKAGGKPEDWQRRSPNVVVQDLEWSAGATLVDFEILGDGKPLDANLYCEVRIVTSTGGQSNPPRTVTYVVGTDPVLTVFRDMFN